MALAGKISNWQLKLNYWFLTHKELLKKTGVILLIILNLAFWLYSLFGFIFLAATQANYQALLKSFSQDLINFQAYKLKHQPQPLQYSPVTVFGGREGRWDFVSEVENLNKDWLAFLDYQFVVSGRLLGLKQTFILPGESKFIFSLDQKLESGPSDAQLQILKLRWQRQQNAEKVLTQRLNFKVTESSVSPLKIDSLIATRADFKVKNESAYNFWQVGFIVSLYTGPSLVGVNFVQTDQFTSGQIKELSVSWFENLPPSLHLEVKPEVNVFDSSVFYLPPGEGGQPK